MSSIGNDQKQLLFDYSLGLTSQSESAQAESLISSNEEAADIYRHLQALLAPLESLDLEPCPDELAERTIARLVGCANSGHEGLNELLADDLKHPPRRPRKPRGGRAGGGGGGRRHGGGHGGGGNRSHSR